MSIANNEIEIGDTVRIRWPQHLKASADNSTYTVMGIPLRVNNGATWWTLVGQQTGSLRILTEGLVLEVLS